MTEPVVLSATPNETRRRLLHTAHMRERITAVMRSEDPAVTPAARTAAARALDDPASLSDTHISALAEALTRLASPIACAPPDLAS